LELVPTVQMILEVQAAVPDTGIAGDLTDSIRDRMEATKAE